MNVLTGPGRRDMNTFTGCSGFHYKHWKGLFYPSELSPKQWLPFYAEHLNSVEINNSFYRLPKAKDLKNWHSQTPGNFRFSMKGSRYVTHMKKLVNDSDLRDGIRKFYKAVEPLGGKLGCVLWQLPGNLHRNDEKLKDFCSLLSPDFKNAMEFRHQSWFTEPVMDILSKHKISYCMISAPNNLPEYIHATTDTAYIRFHGKTEWYRYDYSDEELEVWVQRLQQISVKRAYIYFNNDADAKAPQNAMSLQAFLKETIKS